MIATETKATAVPMTFLTLFFPLAFAAVPEPTNYLDPAVSGPTAPTTLMQPPMDQMNGVTATSTTNPKNMGSRVQNVLNNPNVPPTNINSGTGTGTNMGVGPNPAAGTAAGANSGIYEGSQIGINNSGSTTTTLRY